MPGLSFKHFSNCRPRSNPGLCHGTQPMVSPQISLVTFSLSLAAATAIKASGCKWSICLKGSKPCKGVSMDGALLSRSYIQWSKRPTIRSSSARPPYTFFKFLNLSVYSPAIPALFKVPISPPEPLIHMTSTSSLVRGSFSTVLQLVFPPP